MNVLLCFPSSVLDS
uniref:Uncharacterized protein n=1 Tax=Rhizophora mucronata TaxID=61149 RepID=A0A2P2QHN5_RHIMU